MDLIDYVTSSNFLRAKAGTAVLRLSHRNSVRPSVCHTGGSVKSGASSVSYTHLTLPTNREV